MKRDKREINSLPVPTLTMIGIRSAPFKKTKQKFEQVNPALPPHIHHETN